MGSPTWHAKSDDELRELVRAIWDGRAVGTWQLDGSQELERVFPDFWKFQYTKAGDETGTAPVYFATPEAARDYAAIPWPAGAYGPLPARSRRSPGVAPEALPVFTRWELLSWDEWFRVRHLLGFPPPPPPPQQPQPAPAETG